MNKKTDVLRCTSKSVQLLEVNIIFAEFFTVLYVLVGSWKGVSRAELARLFVSFVLFIQRAGSHAL